MKSEIAELKQRLRELEDTLGSIQRGDVDALIVNEGIYTLESAHAATNRLRQDVLAQMEDAVFAFDTDEHITYMNPAAERRYGVVAAEVLGRRKSEVFTEMTRPGSPGGDSGFGELDAGRHRTSLQATHHLASGIDIHVESILSPLTDAAGQTIGSLAVIRDVTERRRAEIRREALSDLSDRIRDQVDPDEIGYAAAAVLGETLGATRAAYGVIDDDSAQLRVGRDWAAADVPSLAGSLSLRNFGALVERLQGTSGFSVDDVWADARTASAAAALDAHRARAFVNVPVVERGRLVAVMVVSDARARHWSAEDLSFIQHVAERTRSAAERARGSVALQASEAKLRESNENLERLIEARTRELLDAEQALRQAQKMEAVGQLTGGIAHDFNNLLASIGASLQVLQARIRKGRLEDVDRYFSMGQDSVRRAAALTQRLLAFARRQTLDSKPTDVNRLVTGMEELVRRTVGPNVVVEVHRAEGLWLTKVDPSQLENSLLNLCINARDAILPGAGRMSIVTANLELDGRAAAAHDLPAGPYIALSVSDTGSGMSADVIKRVFDPFFTTKPLGKGTGLGLSMVYGFVRQSGGQVRVVSAPGEGTTMSLYLPRYLGPVDEEAPSADPDREDADAGGTVLVIEDEANIRVLVAEVLGEEGFRVLTAADGAQGLKILQAPGRIDLLVSDVGLPGGLNGRQVADAARQVRPALKVLFITGYAENAAVGDGELEQGMAVMTKPFDVAALAKRVRSLTGH